MVVPDDQASRSPTPRLGKRNILSIDKSAAISFHNRTQL